MATEKATFNWVTRTARVGVIVSLVFLAAAVIGGVAGAIFAAISDQSWMIVGLWALQALAAAALGVWVFVIYGVVEAVVANERAVASTAARIGRAETLLENQAESTRKLVELASLPDQAKSLIYRDAEIDAIRENIHEDIMRQDYTAAEALIDAIEKKLGYTDIAARMREEVAASRQRTLEEQIDAAVARITEIVGRRC